MKEVKYINIAKAIGIILVVIGHTENNFVNFIYLFHMPLFFFISGYLYKDSYTHNIALLIKRKIKTLYIPFITYEILFLSLHNVFYKLNIYSDQIGFKGQSNNLYSIKEYFVNLIKILTFGGTEEMAGAFWFLLSLFSVTIMFAFIRLIFSKMLKKNCEIIFFINVIIISYIGYKINLPRNLNTSMVMLLIFYLGYSYKKWEKLIPLKVGMNIMAVLVLLVLNRIGSISVGNNTYYNYPFLILSSLCGIYFIISLSKYIEEKKILLSFLNYVGENTMIILAFHFLSFKIVSYIQVKMYDLPDYMLAKFPVLYSGDGWWILYSLVGIVIPIIIKRSLNLLINITRRRKHNV